MIESILEFFGRVWPYIIVGVIFVLAPSLGYFYLRRRLGKPWTVIVIAFPFLFGALYLIFNRGRFLS